ncbi:hypothetical protein [[Kitasatospora] papulosa]
MTTEQPDFPFPAELKAQGEDVEIVTPGRLMNTVHSDPEATLDCV